jgi:hypothetical protein
MDQMKYYKRNSNTNMNLNPLALEKNSFSRRRSSDHLTTLTSSTTDEDNESTPKNSHLNYLIEIDHPYQLKCLMKGEHIFETLEICSKLKKLSMD